MQTITNYEIKDMSLAEQGKKNIEWAQKDMPVAKRFASADADRGRTADRILGAAKRSAGTGHQGGGNRDPKLRSKTFPGIGRAMAEQWAGDIRERSDAE